MKPAPKTEQADQPQAPAKITELHVLGRPATDDKMKEIIGRQAWTKLTVFQKYAAQASDPLSGGCPKYSAENRRQAGNAYAKLWDTSKAPGRDSTQALNRINGGGGSPGDAISKAESSLACIHSHMGEKDRKIIMNVCGRGYWPSEAVRTVCGDYKDSVSNRFREALDALCEAMETARRHPGRVNMERWA